MWFGLIWHKYLWSSLGISMLMWNSEKSGSNLDISCVLGETLSLNFSFFHLWNKDNIWYDLLCIGVIRINKGITMENFKDTLHKLNTNHLKKANFFLLCHFFALQKWQHYSHIWPSLCPVGIRWKCKRRNDSRHWSKEIQPTGHFPYWCEQHWYYRYLWTLFDFFELLSYEIKILAMYQGSSGITLDFRNLSYWLR